MKRRWWILIGVLALVAGWFIFGRSREPMHDGKPVSYWFKEYYSLYEGGHPQHTGDEISHAMATLGTNALPYLVREALSTRQDSRWRSNYYALLEKLPESWNAPRFISLDAIRDRAVSAIGETEPPPELLLPLVRQELNSPNPLLHRQGLRILNASVDGKEDRERLLAPYFIPALRLADRESRHLAVEFLNGIGAPARPAIPDLIAILDDQHGEDALYLRAAATLGSLGADAKEALPKLQTLFNQESNLWARFDLAVALLQIDTNQSVAMNFLLQELKDITPYGSVPATSALLAMTNPNGFYHGSVILPFYGIQPGYNSPGSSPWALVAADRLGLVGTNAQAAIPALVEAMRGTNAAVVGVAANALRLIRARKELFLPILSESLKSDDENIRLAAAYEIVKTEPADPGAREVLLGLIRGNSRQSVPAIFFLAETAPESLEITAVLEQALKSSDQGIRDAASAALERIKQKETRPK